MLCKELVRIVLSTDWTEAPENSSLQTKIDCPLKWWRYLYSFKSFAESIGCQYQFNRTLPYHGHVWGAVGYSHRHRIFNQRSFIITIYPHTLEKVLDKAEDSNDTSEYKCHEDPLIHQVLTIAENALTLKFKSLGIPHMSCKGWIYKNVSDCRNICDYRVYLDSKLNILKRRYVNTLRGYSNGDKTVRKKSIRINEMRKRKGLKMYNEKDTKDTGNKSLLRKRKQSDNNNQNSDEPLLKRRKVMDDDDTDSSMYSSNDDEYVIDLDEDRDHNFVTDENGFVV